MFEPKTSERPHKVIRKVSAEVTEKRAKGRFPFYAVKPQVCPLVVIKKNADLRNCLVLCFRTGSHAPFYTIYG